MSLNQIDLRIKYNHKHTNRFNPESWCIPELYWRKLKDYDTKKVNKCTIYVSDDWGDKEYYYTNWSDSKGMNVPFNFDEYFASDNYKKKKMQLEAIHEGMVRIAEKEGWQIDPLFDAYNQCLADNLEYKFLVGKPKSSPNRKYKFNFWCNWDIDVFELYWVLQDKKGNELKKEKFIEREPYRGEFIYYVKFKWIDNETVLLEDNYKYGNKEKWEINLSDFINELI
jgi:hypothetical protein